jgi:hypothetical protein
LRNAISGEQQKHKTQKTCVVGPSVYADLMASHVFLEQHQRTFNDARANDEEGRQDLLRAKVIEEFPAQSKVLNHHTKKCPTRK